MHALPIRTLMIAALVAGLIASPFAAARKPAETETSYTAGQLSSALIAGVRIGAEKGLVQGQIAAQMGECLGRFPDNALAPIYERLMRERISAEEMRQLDAFYDSDAGRRYFRWSLKQLREQQQLPATDTIELTAEEQDRAQTFHTEGVGRKLNALSDGSDPAADEALRTAMADLVATCR